MPLMRVAVLLLLATSASAQLPAELDAYIEKARAEWEVPGLAVAVVRDGKVVAAKGYGVRRLGAPERVDEHTLFDIASLTKSFTAAAVATLVDEGKMRWDDPVRRHLPSIEFGDAQRTQSVTMRDLLAHRVGLESGNLMLRFSGVDTAEALRRIRYLEERAPLRGSMIYSNILYSAAGEAAAAAAGMRWEELVQKRLLDALGMRESVAGVPHDRFPNHASPHSRIGGVQQPIRNWPWLNIMPASMISSNAHDLTRWLLFNLGDGTWEGKRVLSTATLRELQSPQIVIPTTPEFRAARNVRFFAGYGLGWQVMDYRGRPMLWHSGNADGMPVYMAILPEEKIGVAVMLNSWVAPVLHGSIAARILDTLLGEPLRDTSAEALAAQRRNLARVAEMRAEFDAARATGTRPSRPLQAYAGTYANALYGDLVIGHDDGKLTMKVGNGETADLSHWHYDTFAVRWRDAVFREEFSTWATFMLDARGNPKRLEMRLGREEIAAVKSNP